jgi:hypothetical protein
MSDAGTTEHFPASVSQVTSPPTTHVFLTEHGLTGLTDAHLRSVRAALTETTRRTSLSGGQIQLLDCRYVLGQRLVCTFAASSEAQVRRAVDLAQLPHPGVFRSAGPDPGIESGTSSAIESSLMPAAGVDGETG